MKIELTESEIILIHSITLSAIDGFTISREGLLKVLKDNTIAETNPSLQLAVEDAEEGINIAKGLIEKLNPIVETQMQSLRDGDEIPEPRWKKEE